MSHWYDPYVVIRIYPFLVHYLSPKCNKGKAMSAATSGTGTVYPEGWPEVSLRFSWCSCCPICSFLCRSLIVLFLWAIISSFVNVHCIWYIQKWQKIFLYFLTFLAHITQNEMWAIVITWRWWSSFAHINTLIFCLED